MSETCKCGYADSCDGETAVFYPLQDGGMCSVRSCRAPPTIDQEPQPYVVEQEER